MKDSSLTGANEAGACVAMWCVIMHIHVKVCGFNIFLSSFSSHKATQQVSNI